MQPDDKTHSHGCTHSRRNQGGQEHRYEDFCIWAKWMSADAHPLEAAMKLWLHDQVPVPRTPTVLQHHTGSDIRKPQRMTLLIHWP